MSEVYGKIRNAQECLADAVSELEDIPVADQPEELAGNICDVHRLIHCLGKILLREYGHDGDLGAEMSDDMPSALRENRE